MKYNIWLLSRMRTYFRRQYLLEYGTIIIDYRKWWRLWYGWRHRHSMRSPKCLKKYISCRNCINTYVYVFIWLANAINAFSARYFEIFEASHAVSKSNLRYLISTVCCDCYYKYSKCDDSKWMYYKITLKAHITSSYN